MPLPPPLPTACIKTEGRDPRSPSPFHNRLLIGPLFSKLCVGSHRCCECECQLMPGCQHSTPLPIPPALTFFLHLHLQCLQCPLSLERTDSEAPILAGHSLVNYLFSVFWALNESLPTTLKKKKPPYQNWEQHHYTHYTGLNMVIYKAVLICSPCPLSKATTVAFLLGSRASPATGVWLGLQS